MYDRFDEVFVWFKDDDDDDDNDIDKYVMDNKEVSTNIMCHTEQNTELFISTKTMQN